MKSELRRAALGLMLLGLYGCGLKGPLYFPPADKSEQKRQLMTTRSSTQSPVQTASPGDDGSTAVGTEQP
ncbi:LPS translocon maturation chaperone LptM [Sodalis glossinidius]|uniref:LPS translocon maturation chaperone LptM n=1 Tax=Sodalis glossinidius TaxID=63612 RepID=UPI0005A4ACE1|nr:lipoprotein [Sodalis glossinidius]